MSMSPSSKSLTWRRAASVFLAFIGVASLADGFSGLDQIGAFVGYVAIVASFVLAWSLYASDYSRYLRPDTDTRKVFWYTMISEPSVMASAPGSISSSISV